MENCICILVQDILASGDKLYLVSKPKDLHLLVHVFQRSSVSTDYVFPLGARDFEKPEQSSPHFEQK